MTEQSDEYLDFSSKINEYISALMLGLDIGVDGYNYDLMWQQIEAKGVRIRPFPFNGPARSRISGIIVKDLAETTIGFNSNMSAKRINFTVSHEIIHYLYHLSDEHHMFTDTKASLAYTDIDILPEFQANVGASAILLPDPVLIYVLKEGESPYTISSKYGISESALSLRLIQTMQAEFDASYNAAAKTNHIIMNRHGLNGKKVMQELGHNLERKIIMSNPFYEAICQ